MIFPSNQSVSFFICSILFLFLSKLTLSVYDCYLSRLQGGDTTIFSGSGTTETGATETGGGGTTERDQTGFQEDEDKYLLQQAVAAARAIHHVQGVEYDETLDINVMADIKFVVATVALPFGCEYCVCALHIDLYLLYINSIPLFPSLRYLQCSFKNMKLVCGYPKSCPMAMPPRRVFNMEINLLLLMGPALSIPLLMKWRREYQALQLT